MKRNLFFHLLLTALIALLAGQVFAQGPKFRRAGQPVRGEYIVVLNDTPRDQVDPIVKQLAASHQVEIITVLKHGIKAFGARMTEQRAMALSQNPLVAFVEENGYAELSVITQTFSDDTYWNLDRLDQRAEINSTKSYSYTKDGTGVRAYVIDTGIQAFHREFNINGTIRTFESRVEPGANMVVSWGDYFGADNPCGGFFDYYGAGHGTAVASVLGGKTTGVARDVALVPVKVATCNPSNGSIAVYTLAIAWGLDWIIADMESHPNDRAVVSMSVFVPSSKFNEMCDNGSGGLTNCVSAMEHNINQVISANIPVVVSANNQNNGSCNTSPARMGYGGTYPTSHHTITVGGTMYRQDGTNKDVRWDCPAEGCPYQSTDKGSNFGPCVSIYAPAWQIRSAHIKGYLSYRSVELQKNGTSFSAPYVAGVVARMLDKDDTLSPYQVWLELQADATIVDEDLDAGSGQNHMLVYRDQLE